MTPAAIYRVNRERFFRFKTVLIANALVSITVNLLFWESRRPAITTIVTPSTPTCIAYVHAPPGVIVYATCEVRP